MIDKHHFEVKDLDEDHTLALLYFAPGKEPKFGAKLKPSQARDLALLLWNRAEAMERRHELPGTEHSQTYQEDRSSCNVG